MAKTAVRFFNLAGAVDLDTLRARISDLRLEPGPMWRGQRALLDSFDWRLWAAGLVLEGETDATGATLRLYELTQGRLARTQRVPVAPRFAADLPPGPLRRALAPLLEVRALLPHAPARRQRQDLALVDGEGKTTARLTLTTDHTAAGRHRRIALEPVTGYGVVARRLGSVLADLAGVPTPAPVLFREDLEAAGLVPGGYTSKPDIPLEPDQRADKALKVVLGHLLSTMTANQDGMLGEVDSEFLHDYRVAVRRTRSALGQVKGVFPDATTRRYRKAFAWLGTITSPPRDMDVYLLAFPEYRRSVPTRLRRGLDPLKAFLERRRDSAYRELRRHLGSTRYHRLVADWRAFLDAPPPARPRAPRARDPIKGVADARIWRMARRVYREGEAIGPGSPPEALHELRKSCKKLRYLMEFFRRLYPDVDIGARITTLKRFQDNLGAFQDYSFQVLHLHQFLEEMATEDTLADLTREAMAALTRELEQRREEVRGEFARRFTEFSREENRAAFRALFHPQTPA